MKRILLVALLGLLVAGAELAQAAGTNTVLRNGYCFNATTGQLVDCVTGAARTDDANRDRDYVLAPQLIFSGTIADGAADSTTIVDLSPYRTVALLVQVKSNGPNDWLRLAVNARYNFGGGQDSLSLFTIPVQEANMDSVAAAFPANRVSVPTAALLGAGEFPVTINMTTGLGTASTASLPQGKVVPLATPPGFAWPASCSFRIRNIAREGTAVTPTIKVWVIGTAL